jgi:hypothetical protein
MTFEQLLSGGHPNSLGRTVEVVGIVLSDKSRLAELFDCYFSNDEVVRLRVSNAMKRICKVYPEWLVPYIDRLLDEIATVDQASTKWTLAQLFLMLEKEMTATQKEKAVKVLQHNLETSDDWIVQNMTMETLGKWAINDEQLRDWLLSQLDSFRKSSRKSVAKRAEKIRIGLNAK